MQLPRQVQPILTDLVGVDAFVDSNGVAGILKLTPIPLPAPLLFPAYVCLSPAGVTAEPHVVVPLVDLAVGNTLLVGCLVEGVEAVDTDGAKVDTDDAVVFLVVGSGGDSLAASGTRAIHTFSLRRLIGIIFSGRFTSRLLGLDIIEIYIVMIIIT